jgi:hypothetical protein
MTPVLVPIVGARQWQPRSYAPSRLAQAAPAPKPGLLDIDGPVVAVASDVTASVATAILGYSFGRAGSRWSTVFWMISGVTGFKALIDLSRFR